MKHVFASFRIRKPNWLYQGLILVILIGISPSLIANPSVSLQPSQIQLKNFTFDQIQQAAEAGDPDAQYALGYMYYYGKAVSANQQTALNWIKRAAVQGQSQAINAMSLLGESNFPSAEQSPLYPKNQAAARRTTTVTNTTTNVTHMEDSFTQGPAAASADTATLAKSPAGRYYTIQLLASANKNRLTNFVNTNNLQGQATYSQTKRQGKNWYVLEYGHYGSQAEAQAAVNTLPAQVRAQKVWVKSVGGSAASQPKATTSAAKANKKASNAKKTSPTHKKKSTSQKEQPLSF